MALTKEQFEHLKIGQLIKYEGNGMNFTARIKGIITPEAPAFFVTRRAITFKNFKRQESCDFNENGYFNEYRNMTLIEEKFLNATEQFMAKNKTEITWTISKK